MGVSSTFVTTSNCYTATIGVGLQDRCLYALALCKTDAILLALCKTDAILLALSGCCGTKNTFLVSL